jgi:hypothetical protein
MQLLLHDSCGHVENVLSVVFLADVDIVYKLQ